MKANKGAPGIDGITVDEIGAYLWDNQEAIIERIYKGKYTPEPVRRKEIPKAGGGVRKSGIPRVKDRIFQQAISQQLMPIYEVQFSDGSYGYRSGKVRRIAPGIILTGSYTGATHEQVRKGHLYQPYKT